MIKLQYGYNIYGGPYSPHKYTCLSPPFQPSCFKPNHALTCILIMREYGSISSRVLGCLENKGSDSFRNARRASRKQPENEFLGSVPNSEIAADFASVRTTAVLTLDREEQAGSAGALGYPRCGSPASADPTENTVPEAGFGGDPGDSQSPSSPVESRAYGTHRPQLWGAVAPSVCVSN